MDELATALDRVVKQARIQLETVRASYANRATSADMKDIENIIRATSLRTTEQCKAINDKLDILKEQWGVERGTGNAGSTGNPGNTGSTQWYGTSRVIRPWNVT